MTGRVARVAVPALAAVGVAITSYLVYARYTGSSIVCTGGGCETVQHSRYAVVAGVPVALLGLIGYGILLGLSLVRRDAAHAAAIALTASALAFSAYLLVVQLTLIHAVCVWCVTSDCVLVVILAALVASGGLPHRSSTGLP